MSRSFYVDSLIYGDRKKLDEDSSKNNVVTSTNRQLADAFSHLLSHMSAGASGFAGATGIATNSAVMPRQSLPVTSRALDDSNSHVSSVKRLDQSHVDNISHLHVPALSYQGWTPSGIKSSLSPAVGRGEGSVAASLAPSMMPLLHLAQQHQLQQQQQHGISSASAAMNLLLSSAGRPPYFGSQLHLMAASAAARLPVSSSLLVDAGRIPPPPPFSLHPTDVQTGARQRHQYDEQQQQDKAAKSPPHRHQHPTCDSSSPHLDLKMANTSEFGELFDCHCTVIVIRRS